MAVIPLPEWLPDQPAHMNPGLTVCKNVIPASGGFYAPVKSLIKVISSPASLNSAPKGAFTGRDQNNNVTVFVGHGTALKKITAASTSYVDVTRLSGAYQDIGPFGNWRFTQMGLRVIATNFLDDVQTFTLGSSGNFDQLSAGAPRAKYCAVWAPGFLVLGNLDTDSQGVRWGGINDATSFPTLGSAAAKEAQSDAQIIDGEHGSCSGLTGAVAGADGLIFMERALYRAQYVGPGPVFSILPIEGVRGSPFPGSILWYGGGVAYWSGDGFYMTDGASTVPIGDGKVDEFFSNDVNTDLLDFMSCAYDPRRKLFHWNYQSLNASNASGYRTLVYNWASKRWALWDPDETADMSGNTEFAPSWLFNSSTLGYTVDTADSAGFSIETPTISPDDAFWAGGPPVLAAFFDFPIIAGSQYSLAMFTGPNWSATFETGEPDLGDGRRVTVHGIRPFVDTQSVTCSVGYRDTQAATVTYGAASSPAADGDCKQRINTRFARARISIPKGTVWSKAWAYEPRFTSAGSR